METLLLIVTGASFVAALFLGWTVWRLSRAEQERAMARVAALAAAVADRSSVETQQAPAAVRRLPRMEDATLDASDQIVWAPPRPEELRSAAPSLRSADSELPLHGTSSQMPALRDAFLGSPAQQRRSGQGILAVAALLLLFALGAAAAWVYSTPSATAGAPVAQQTPVELMSLRHAREGDRLSVTGLVRNPASAPAVDHLSATVLLFDQQGGYLTSARERIDMPRLDPGQESPFTLSIQAPAGAARYRVSFRTDERIVPHVDRRNQAPAAASAETTTTR